MAKQTINVGTTVNDGTGDQLRSAFIKVNSNFDELYTSGVGAQGAQGVAGTAGAPGAQGSQGIQGAAGSAGPQGPIGNNANLLSVTSNIVPSVSNTYNLGSSAYQWKDLWVSNNTIYIGNVPVGTSNGKLTVNGNRVIERGDSVPFIEITDQAAPLNIWDGPEVLFIKTDYGNEIDIIDANVHITRANSQAIYNIALEGGWDGQSGDPDGRGSPKGTLWNDDGWDDLTNLDQRTYETFYATMNGNIGNNVLPKQFIMKDVVNNTYYKIDFSVWGNGSAGAPITYTRQQVNPVDGTNIGGLVTFTKPGYADPFFVFDNVSANVKISRASNQSIFNIVNEQGYNNNLPGDGDAANSPQGTEWNLDGWSDLTDVKTRVYEPFRDILEDNIDEYVLQNEFVMHDTINDKYHAIKFIQWTADGDGGGFAYKRRLINTDYVFVHTENGSEIDLIAAGVAITRDTNGSIYNLYDEGVWDEQVSPGGTEWNFDGNRDLSDVETRIYRTFFEAQGFYGIGNKIEGREAVMKVTSTGDYYTIKFLHYQQGGGGAFSYIRTPIDLTKLKEGIKFADGTIQKTAADNTVKFKGPLGRRIEEYYGYEEVQIEQAEQYTLATTMRSLQANTDYIIINVPDEQTAIGINTWSGTDRVMRNLSISFDNEETWIPLEEVGGYGDSGGWYVILYTKDSYRVSYAVDQPAKLRYWRNGAPKLWFDPEKSPNRDGNFRGAIINYHAYSVEAGTIVGQIIVSRDGGEYNATHSESTSGSLDLPQVVLWKTYEAPEDHTSGEGKLYAYRVDGEEDTIKIQWKAIMFYGSEFWD